MKVADHEGAVDVSQVIAAIDWVVQHRNDNGTNVRVLDLAFGTDGTQSYLLDPLAHAVEQAVWYDTVVVVAAGNDGNVAPLRNPAMDPYVIAVGAANTNGTADKSDDEIPDFGNCGTEPARGSRWPRSTPPRSGSIIDPRRGVLGQGVSSAVAEAP